MNKKTIVTLAIIAICLAVLTVAAALIYNFAFREGYEKEQGSKLIYEQLDKDKADADKIKEKLMALAKETGVIGSYTSTYYEFTQDQSEVEYMYTPSSQVTSLMELKEDLSVAFDDGSKGWWSLVKDDKGFVTVTVGVTGEEDTRDYLYCRNSLIDIKNAVFWGDVPQSAAFDGEYTAGGLTLTLKADGSAEAIYSEIIEENGRKTPWNEAYSGSYRRDGEYMDIELNGSPARYKIFEAVGTDADKSVTGFAARYYIKLEA